MDPWPMERVFQIIRLTTQEIFRNNNYIFYKKLHEAKTPNLEFTKFMRPLEFFEKLFP